MTLDDAQVEELRKWSLGLAEDERPEVRAAGKALRMLADDVQAARSQLLEERMIRRALEEQAEAESGGARRGELLGDLLRRLRSARFRSREPEVVEQAESSVLE